MRAPILAAAAAALALTACGQPTPIAQTRTAAAHCTEDSPCWTWSRMGDRQRGVLDLSTGRRVVVGPCTFRHMWMNGNADLSQASDRMRGDWWAIHHGCDGVES